MNPELAKTIRNYVITGVFAVAMGILEAVVVIYIRELYYPQGFDFPLEFLSPRMVTIEWLRETSTIIMIASVGIIAANRNLQRFLFFLYVFAVWDLVYYLVLKLLLGWPASLLTWDVLFLIPFTWASPVLAPVICSLTMILFSTILLFQMPKGIFLTIRSFEWSLLVSGSLLVLYTFMKDYGRLALSHLSPGGTEKQASREDMWTAVTQYVPEDFNWLVFGAGELLILIVLVTLFLRIRKLRSKHQT